MTVDHEIKFQTADEVVNDASKNCKSSIEDDDTAFAGPIGPVKSVQFTTKKFEAIDLVLSNSMLVQEECFFPNQEIPDHSDVILTFNNNEEQKSDTSFDLGNIANVCQYSKYCAVFLNDCGDKIDFNGLTDATFVYDVKRSDILGNLDPRSSYFRRVVGKASRYGSVYMGEEPNVSFLTNLRQYWCTDRMHKSSDGTIFDSMDAQAYNHLVAGGNKYLNMQEHLTSKVDSIHRKITPIGMASVQAILLNWHWQELSRKCCKSVPKLQSEDRSKLSLCTFKRLVTMIDTGQKKYEVTNLHTFSCAVF